MQSTGPSMVPSIEELLPVIDDQIKTYRSSLDTIDTSETEG